ncbi:MAG: purine-nucleoside phosphorylase [Kiritimatiellae bacterium]|nr:purine-nucleoside phosphorylase [Kiritimatiellia bacterium]
MEVLAMQMKYFDEAAGYLPDACFRNPPDLGILLGSGWGASLEADEVIVRIRYADIPGLGASTVKGHSGEFMLYRRGGKLIAAWCGRRHYYEGAGWEPVVLPVEILRRMGCQRLLLTNASGGINPALRPGDFVIIRDHINLVGDNPLVGPHVEEWGERFPDMTEVYAKRLAELLHATANRLGLRVMDGVYAYTSGPCYETPAEIQSYKAQGADVVGMSTVPEAVFAHACGIKVAGLSLVSNLAAGISRRALGHEEVIAAGEAAKTRMAEFVADFIDRL